MYKEELGLKKKWLEKQGRWEMSLMFFLWWLVGMKVKSKNPQHKEYKEAYM